MLSAIAVFIGCTPVFAVDYYDDEYSDSEYEEYEEFEEYNFDTSWFEEHQMADEYIISNSSQLKGLVKLVNEAHYDGFNANQYEDFKGKTIKLTRDITLQENFTPIGRSEEIPFRGTFDGNGHEIKGLNVSENGGYAGLFGYLDGTVKNLEIEGTVKSSGPVCGAFAGYMMENALIWNCTSCAEVTGKAKTGGITGHNDGGTVARCVNYGNVKGTMKVGGVVGENWGTVQRCGNRGEVISSVRGATTYGTGGVCGRSVSQKSLIDRSFNTGRIISGTEGTGGICGYMNASGSEIISSYNTGQITVKNNSVINTDNIRGFAGGIVGIAGVKGVIIAECYNAGQIDNSDISGGIIGCYLNESKLEEEPYIRNNFYLSSSGLRGVGSDNAGKPQNYGEGTQKIAQAALINGSSKLGSAYMEDSQSYYGADGYPVLKWQKKLGKVESKRLTCIPENVQEELDRYIEKNPQNERPEATVLMFFDHSSFSSRAIGDYNEK